MVCASMTMRPGDQASTFFYPSNDKEIREGSGHLDLGDMRLEYRMIGPSPAAAPSLVLLHEGLGAVDIWGKFPEALAAATGAGVFSYSRAGYGKSSPSKLPRSVRFMHEEATQVLP